MNIHEYQAKELLAKFGIAIPRGIAALSVAEAVAAAKQLPGPLYVVKSQIHAGGRGKGKFVELGPDAKGGVRLAKSLEEVEAHAQGDAGQHAGDDPDRGCRQAGQPPADHRRRRHRQGILPLDAGRPRERARRDDRLDRGRDVDRGRGARDAGEDRDDHDRSGRRFPAAPRPRAGFRAQADGRSGQAGAGAGQAAL